MPKRHATESTMAVFRDKCFIQPTKLQPADVILSGDSDRVSRLIRWTTRGNYSHAAICIDDGLLF